MKNNWEIKTLREVCEFRRGLTYSKKDEASLSKNAILRANNITLAANTLNFDDIRYISDDVIIPQEKKLVKGSVMICTASGSRSHLGKVAFIDKDYDYAFGGFMGLLVPNSEIIDPKYFFVILTSGQFRDHINSLTSGANINNLKFSQIKDYQVTVPPLLEQKRIVGILDEKFKAIEELKKVTEAQIQDAKELFESRLSEVFENKARDWSNAKLFDYIKFIDYRGRTPKKTKSGIKLITAKNIKKGYLQNDPEEFIACNDYEAWMTRGIPLKGDILFTTEAPLGNVAKLDTDEKVAFAQRTIIFQMDRKIFDPGFLFYLLLSKPFQTNILGQATGATVLGIKSSLLKKIEISFPKSLDKQKLIFLELYELSEKKDSLEKVFLKKIQDLDELKKSYLEQAFEGKL